MRKKAEAEMKTKRDERHYHLDEPDKNHKKHKDENNPDEPDKKDAPEIE